MKHLYKFLFMATAILSANFATNFIETNALRFLDHHFSKKIAAAGVMLLIVTFFYPIYTLIDGGAEKFSRFIAKTGKSFLGGKIGPLICFGVVFVILFYLYYSLWFGGIFASYVKPKF